MSWFDIGRIIGGGALMFVNPALGASVAASGIQGLTAGKAADTLEKGNERAMQIEREMLDQTRADFKPFYEGGTQAYRTVGQLMGLGVPADGQYVSPGGKLKPVGWTPEGNYTEGQPFGTRVPTADAKYTGARAVPRGSVPPSFTVGDLTESGMNPSGAGRRGPQPAMSETIEMEAPDRTRMHVPAGAVPWLLEEGARIVG